MHTLIERHIPEISALCRRYGVQRLEVFGSAARGADFDETESDADFLVEFASGDHMAPLTQFVGLADDLQALLGRPIDLVEAGAVENPFILASIENARETVYAG